MFTDPIQFYFVKTGAHGPLSTDLATITDQLGTYAGDGIALKRDPASLTISYDQSPMRAVLTIEKESSLTDVTLSNQMVLTCERADPTSINLLRNIIKNMGYRVFNPELSAYNSQDPDLLDLTTIALDKKIVSILKNTGFKPLFNYRNNLIFFATKNGGKAIYQINSDLLLHLTEQGMAPFDEKDLCVKVADDIGHFIALYDRGMIQGSFYAKFERSKIQNYSDIDIKKLPREVFVRPIFFAFNRERQSFDQVLGHTTRRDSLKKGSNLNTYLGKVLSSSGITQKFLGAKIQRTVNYEENEKGKLIPRLNMIIFTD